jgi:tRNA(adenine34) deaminase
MPDTVDAYMQMAIQEARLSLREGNHGFGAVIVRDGCVIARAHDLEETTQDPTAHAELLAIRYASQVLGKSLHGCRLYATHEPCPMCASAAVWARLDYVGFGYGISDAIAQGRKRIALGCRDVFSQAGAAIEVEGGLSLEGCAPLYDREVREEICRLRGASSEQLRAHGEALAAKRLRWYQANAGGLALPSGDSLERAYALLLVKLGIRPDEAPVVRRTPTALTFLSANRCPTLEACRILDLDTRRVCSIVTESATEVLLQQLDPRLRFTRRYETLRPHGDCCEETIFLDGS